MELCWNPVIRYIAAVTATIVSACYTTFLALDPAVILLRHRIPIKPWHGWLRLSPPYLAPMLRRYRASYTTCVCWRCSCVEIICILTSNFNCLRRGVWLCSRWVILVVLVNQREAVVLGYTSSSIFSRRISQHHSIPLVWLCYRINQTFRLLAGVPILFYYNCGASCLIFSIQEYSLWWWDEHISKVKGMNWKPWQQRPRWWEKGWRHHCEM